MARMAFYLVAIMNITKLFFIAGVAVTGALFAPSAQARDHDHDRDRHEYRHHRHYHHRDYHRSYYSQRRAVIYNEGYYSRPRTSVTIAVGGHRHDRHNR